MPNNDQLPPRRAVSICLPVYNGRRFLAQAIESVLNQSFYDFELIIADDDSADDSWAVIQKFASRDSRIHAYRHEANVGLFNNYNFCIQQCTGKYIKLFAQDDLLLPDALSKMVAVLEADPTLALVAGARTLIDERSEQIRNEGYAITPQLETGDQAVGGEAVIKHCMQPLLNRIGEPSAVMFPRQHAGEGFDTTLRQLGDLEYWWRILRSGNYRFLNEPLYAYRVHNLSATTSNNKFLLYASDTLRIGRKHKSLFANLGIPLSEFAENAIQQASADLASRGEQWRRRVLDRQPPILDELELFLRQGSLDLAINSAIGYFELCLHSLSLQPAPQSVAPSDDRSRVIRKLETRLRAYLSSPSWRHTKFLRDINALFSGREEALECLTSMEEGANDQQKYERFLRVQLNKLKHSRSWTVTKPLRDINRLWIQYSSDDAGQRTMPEADTQAAKAPMPQIFPEDLPAPSAVTSPKDDRANPDLLIVDSVKPDISVIVPTYNRAHVLEAALNSIAAQSFQNWECLIVDDGSTDDTAKLVRHRCQLDSRFRYVYQEHHGVSRARNVGLQHARGKIIAYLDSDNVWFPNYLDAIRTALVDTDVDVAYAAQLVQDEYIADQFSVRWQPFDYAQLQQANYIDLNIFAHQKKLVEEFGGFDEALKRLDDWDLILRYCENTKVLSLSTVGGAYNASMPDSISKVNPLAHDKQLIANKQSQPHTSSALRVLYAVWHYPQLSESYIETEIRAVSKLGVTVEVWTQQLGVAASYPPSVRIHRGSFEEAVTDFKPDVVHTHWMLVAKEIEPLARAAHLPLTVRSHGFEFASSYGPLLAELDELPAVESVYLFPQHARMFSHDSTKIRPLPAVFNEDLYKPTPNKNIRQVIRTGTGLPTKNYRCFMETAKLCPRHQFVLVIGSAFTLEHYVDELLAMNRSMGNPVEIRVDLPYEDVSKLVGESGIYLHTTDDAAPFGMPVSIIESMATGCHPLLTRRQESLAYTKGAARYYSSAEEAAALINETLWWSDADWIAARRRSIDEAYQNFASQKVLRALVADWQEIAARTPSRQIVVQA